MGATDLIKRLTSAGCKMRIDGGQLVVRDPGRALTDDLRQAIREHKAELLALLRSEPANDQPTPCPACGDTERWPTTRGSVCVTCFLNTITPEPAPSYIKRCARCGGTEWGPTGRVIGGEVWGCMGCAKWRADEVERRRQVEAGGTVVANMKRDQALIGWAKAKGVFLRVDRKTKMG